MHPKVTTAIEHLRQDKQLKTIIDTVELDYHWEPDERGDVYWQLQRAIVGQQISVKAAASIFERFLLLFPDGYPHPKLLLDMSDETLRGAGLSKQKLRYVHAVAEHFVDNDLLNQDWEDWSDDDIMKELVQIKGVGEWSVRMILMFCLQRADILPTKDLGIQYTMQRLYGLEETGTALRRKMETVAAPWRPYRTLACFYLWSWKHRW
ncbi:MAG: DNA-3-methyladenine glycosylase 2 family protein [Bacteroidota bacterium]